MTPAAESHTIRVMRVLVTGGTGFLGSHLVERLLEEPGAEVHALVRDPSKLRWLEGIERVRLLTGDLQNLPALPAGLGCVFHLAGLTKTFKASDYYTVNREGTANLLRALEGQSCAPRFVHLGSIAAGGPSAPRRPVCEGDPPRPVSPYGESKLMAEAEILKYKDRFPVVILRAAAVYGPRDEDFLEYFRWMKRGILPLVGQRRKSLSLLYVRDAVRAILLAARPGIPSGEVFNIADPRIYTWEDIGRTVAGLLGNKLVRVRLPLWTAYLASAASEGIGRLGGGASALNVSKYKQMKPDCWVADVRKARQGLGFESRFSLEEGLGETIAWYLWKGLL
ncbi:MAG: NAD(P)-dependent oxidoreductase [Acidobacteria bacterium]|nr:NAD(P)-dependent oxidoreductase [Acidobacteriota bacterium]